ncbi:MAG: acyltransferase [Beijerinckiaceae bacterium]|nr:acyltransferase [Beijerinckiaceae bacterium]
MQNTALTYRADIDGLRAIAVGAVVAFHAEINFIHGGYVGVDVFFVISGYLITSILLVDLQAFGSLRLADFYRRRLSRILPALFVVLVATACLSLRYFYPDEIIAFSQSLIGAALSAANVYFYATAGYFDEAAAAKPLLHTWSLGVEEQFYLVMPFVLATFWKFAPTRLPLALGLTSLASFALCLAMTPLDRSAAFYLLPFRAWELGLGAALAAAMPGRTTPLASPLLAAALCLAGITAILLAVLAYDETTPFPGYAALLPCLGAAAIILAGATPNPVSRALGCLPMRGIGLVSYSLYLWHWPLLVFQRQNAIVFGDSAHLSAKLGIVAIALLLAIVTYWLVERPMRRASRSVGFGLVAASAAAATACLIAAATATILSGGFASRYPEQALALKASVAVDFSHLRPGRCFIFEDAGSSTPLDPACLRAAEQKRNVLLIGDSHAAHLWSGLQDANPTLNVEQATGSGCAPVWRRSLVALPLCDAVVKAALDRALTEPPPDEIILAARWKMRDFEALGETLDRLASARRKVTVIGPIVEYAYPLPRLLADAVLRGDDEWVRRNRNRETEAIDAALGTFVGGHGARYLSLVDLLCERHACITLDRQGRPIQFDYGHLTRAGSALVAERLRERNLIR